MATSDESWADESDDGEQWWSGMLGNKVNYSISLLGDEIDRLQKEVDEAYRAKKKKPAFKKKSCEECGKEKFQKKTKKSEGRGDPSGTRAAGFGDKNSVFDPNRMSSLKVDPSPGELGDMAATMLMTLLYTARVGRFDLFRPIQFLSKIITRWDGTCDKRLHQLMCYVNATAEDMMVGWIGDSPDELTAHMFCDANFAGCPYTLRSTSGTHMDIQGPSSRFPWGVGSTQRRRNAPLT